MVPRSRSWGHLNLGRLEGGVMNKIEAACAERMRALQRAGESHGIGSRASRCGSPTARSVRGAGRRRDNGAARGERVAGVLSHTGCGPMDGARGEATLRMDRLLRAVRQLDESDPVGAGALAGGVGSLSVRRECESDGRGNDARPLAGAPGHTG